MSDIRLGAGDLASPGDFCQDSHCNGVYTEKWLSFWHCEPAKVLWVCWFHQNQFRGRCADSRETRVRILTSHSPVCDRQWVTEALAEVTIPIGKQGNNSYLVTRTKYFVQREAQPLDKDVQGTQVPSLLLIILCRVDIRCLPDFLPCALPASPPHPTNHKVCTGQFHQDCNTGCFPLPERTIQPPLLLSTSPCLTVHKNGALKCKVSQVEAALCLLLLTNELMSVRSGRWYRGQSWTGIPAQPSTIHVPSSRSLPFWVSGAPWCTSFCIITHRA